MSSGAKRECQESVVPAFLDPKSIAQGVLLAKKSFGTGISAFNLCQVPSAKPKAALFHRLHKASLNYLITIFII
jgi:hypothetical protein